MKKRNSRAQEEIVGFALIIIIVAVILLVFLGFYLRSSGKETIESYEAESFIASSLQYTTECRDNFGYLSVQDLIFDCYENEKCLDDTDTCEVLNSSLKGILEKSWEIGENTPVKGYEFRIISDEKEILFLNKGQITSNSKGSSQPLGKKSIEVFFTIYY